MPKNIKIENKTHARLKKFAAREGLLLAVLADRLITEALDAREADKTADLLRQSLQSHPTEQAPPVPAGLENELTGGATA